MKPISQLLSTSLTAGGKLEMIIGECATHGASEAAVRVGAQWHCGECLNIARLQEIRNEFAKDRHEHLLRCANIPQKFQGKRFRAETEAQREVRKMVVLFKDNIVAKQEWAALVLVGSNGTGKTLLACEFAEMYMSRFLRSARYVSASSMISEIQAAYSAKDGRTADGEIERFAWYDLLIIDEIDVKKSSDDAGLLLNEVISRRYANNKPVIVISNQPLSKFEVFLGKRIEDRLHENAFVCSFDWESARRKPFPERPKLTVVA